MKGKRKAVDSPRRKDARPSNAVRNPARVPNDVRAAQIALVEKYYSSEGRERGAV